MRLRASFTLENSIIIPLFTLIIVALSLLAFLLHDHVVIKNACFQTAIVMNDYSNNKNSADQAAKLEQKSEEYIFSKIIYLKSLNIFINTKNDKTDISISGKGDRIPFLVNTNVVTRDITVEKAQYLKTIRVARLINHALNVQDGGKVEK